MGGALLKLGTQDALRRSKLVQKRVYLPRSGLHMNYLEREASPAVRASTTAAGASADGNNGTAIDDGPPTLLFCHGLSDEARNMAAFVHSLSIPGHVRILVPDQVGHGADLERARSDPDSYGHPTPSSMLESTSEFLDAVGAGGSNCHAFGISLGGAIVYYLQHKRPDVVRKSVLVSPAIRSCIGGEFVDDFVEGRKRHMCYEGRRDVKVLFRDLSTESRRRKDPVPKFFLEAIYRDQKKRAPEGHYKDMLHILIGDVGGGKTCSNNREGDSHDDANGDDDNSDGDDMGGDIFFADKDVDPNARRLVLWPDKDYICNHESGKRFFKDSPRTEFQTLSDCGHVFHSDGTFILDLVRGRVREYLLDFCPPSASAPR